MPPISIGGLLTLVAARVLGPEAAACPAKRCRPEPYRLVTRADGSVWLRTFGFRMRATVTWDAPVYLSHDRFHVARSYRT